MPVKPKDRDHQAVTAALHQLDPCGIVDLDAVRAAGTPEASLLPDRPSPGCATRTRSPWIRPPAAYGLPLSKWPDRRETEIAGKAAVSFWNETRSSFDIYLSPTTTLTAVALAHIQVQALPARGDGSRASAKLEESRTETAIKVIADVTRKHFAG